MAKLSVIIPFGTSKERPFITERVLKKILEMKHKYIEAIFVEGFSSEYNKKLKYEIEKNGHKYLKDNNQTKFSVGACRNLGVQYASAPVITFIDVDYYMSKNTLNKILQLIEVKGIATHPNRFFFLPCAFLTEEGTKYLYNNNKEMWDTIVQYDIISKKQNIVKFFAISSSSPVMNKHKFLELGGNDLSFEGHGYEDFDFYYRLFKSSGRIEVMPEKLEYDSRSWNFVDYKGFRAMMSVPGYEASFYGIYLYHFWHQEPNNDGYLDNRELNHQKFYNRIKKYFIMSDGPDSLQINESINKKILAFLPENSKVYRSLRGLTPYIGKLICSKEDIFFEDNIFNIDLFGSYIKNNNIDMLLFPNPYGNEKRLLIYNYVRKYGIPYICYDRGALPDSWFIDANGFNYDSSSYSENNWNNELTEDQYNEVSNYIDYIKKSENFLERQGERLGSNELKQKLGIRHKKVVFIPLQVETDSVIKYFTREPFTYYGFLKIADNVAGEIENQDWVILAKKHPLMSNIDKNKYKNIKFVPDDTNLIDLLDISDIVLTINSGVGVYAMMFEKPCLLAGNAFYAFEGINYNVYSENDILNYILREKVKLDKEKMYRFIYYLYKKFYCFGKSYYSNINKNNRIIRIVNYIDFYRIVFDKNIYLDGIDSNIFVYAKNILCLRPYAFEINSIIMKNSTSKSLKKNENINNDKMEESNLKNKIIYKKIMNLIKNTKLFFKNLIKNGS